jgi:AraC family carnitine catabolism transcriptional activator
MQALFGMKPHQDHHFTSRLNSDLAEGDAYLDSEAFSDVERFGFLLIPGFSMLSFASMLEPLRMANRASKKELYAWDVYTPDNGPVLPSNGIAVTPTRRLDQCDDLHTMMVVAGLNPLQHNHGEIKSWLRQLDRQGVRLGSTSSGAVVLANARLLNGYKSTLHWEHIESFREQYPGVRVSAELFELDRDRLTCSGGTAGLDMMLHMIKLEHGAALANCVAEQCIHPQIRLANDLQRMALPVRLNIDHPKVLEAVGYMENHQEDPLPCSTLAQLVDLSQRQLERLFQTHLGITPAAYYKRMRLDRATALLEQTQMSIFQVGVACGYSSASHFSASYEQMFGRSPSSVRHKLSTKTGIGLPYKHFP